jgi:hypothetical protein
MNKTFDGRDDSLSVGSIGVLYILLYWSLSASAWLYRRELPILADGI